VQLQACGDSYYTEQKSAYFTSHICFVHLTQGGGEGGDEQGTVQRDATEGAGVGLAAEEAST